MMFLLYLFVLFFCGCSKDNEMCPWLSTIYLNYDTFPCISKNITNV